MSIAYIFMSRVSDTVFLPGSTFQISLDPDPGFKFLWIQIRIRFQPPDPGAKIECKKGYKSYLFEENLKLRLRAVKK